MIDDIFYYVSIHALSCVVYLLAGCGRGILGALHDVLGRHNDIRNLANQLMIRRLLVERTERHGWDPNNLQYRSRRSLRNAAKHFDQRLTAVQRVLSRFGKPKLQNSLTIEIEKAKTLRGIAASLVGIHDTLRYLVCFPVYYMHFPNVCPVLTLRYKAHLPSLDPTAPSAPPPSPGPSGAASPAPGSAFGSSGGSAGAAGPSTGGSPSGASADENEEEDEGMEEEDEEGDEEMEEEEDEEEVRRGWAAELARIGF